MFSALRSGIIGFDSRLILFTRGVIPENGIPTEDVVPDRSGRLDVESLGMEICRMSPME